MVTEHSYITYGNSIRVYVNPFKDCPTAEKLFHGIGLVLQGRINPYMYSKLPYIVGTEKLPEGTLEEGNEHPDAMTFNVIHEKGKQLLYKDARSCYIHLRKLNPQLLPLPAKKLDIIEGLQEIQDCCADVAGRKEVEYNQKSGKAGDAAGLKKRFEFHPGQIRFDKNDLGLPSGEPIEMLKKLVDCFGVTVNYTEFDKNYTSATPGTVHKTKGIVSKNLKNNSVPCEIVAKRNEGYVIQEMANATK